MAAFNNLVLTKLKSVHISGVSGRRGAESPGPEPDRGGGEEVGTVQLQGGSNILPGFLSDIFRVTGLTPGSLLRHFSPCCKMCQVNLSGIQLMTL